MGTDSPSGTGPLRGRLQFIDLLRGGAVLVMIETHVLNAALRDQLRGETAYQVLSFINGLVAPSFIFASGFVFAIALRRKLPDYLAFGPALVRQVWRLLFVLGLGYVLHLPIFSLRALLAGVPAQKWTAFWAVDVLQCIAVSLLLVMLVLQIVRTEQRLFAVLPWLAAAIALLTPLIWNASFSRTLPLPISSYLNAETGSQFPLFPWSVFLLAGVIAGGVFVAARGRTPAREGDDPVRQSIRRFALFGAGLILGSFVIETFLSPAYPPHDYWRASPGFLLLRLGLVLLLLCLCYVYERWRGAMERSPVALVGRESLLVYAAHLLILYGDFGGVSFLRWSHRSFGYVEVCVVSALLIGLMILLAFWWDRVRRGDRARMRLLQGLAAGALLLTFLVSPG